MGALEGSSDATAKFSCIIRLHVLSLEGKRGKREREREKASVPSRVFVFFAVLRSNGSRLRPDFQGRVLSEVLQRRQLPGF